MEITCMSAHVSLEVGGLGVQLPAPSMLAGKHLVLFLRRTVRVRLLTLILLFTVTSVALPWDFISSNSRNLLQFLQLSYRTLWRRKEENLLENHTHFPMVYEIHTETSSLRALKIMSSNLNEIVQCTFMNSASGLLNWGKRELRDIWLAKFFLQMCLGSRYARLWSDALTSYMQIQFW
jgi:hypothetical protein